MIEYKIGDIFNDVYKLDVIAHQCNCRGVFNMGFGGVVNNRYPEVGRLYQAWYDAGLQELGAVQLTTIDYDDLIVANLYTQGYDERQKKTYTNCNALERCLRTLKFLIPSGVKLGMPKFDVNLGSSDWNVIEPIINDVFHDQTVYVYLL